MAKGYRALSNIQHGEDYQLEDGSVGNRIREFPYGATVTGLDNGTMKSLWDLGVLEEFEVPEVRIVERSPSTPASGSSGETPAPQE